MTKCEACMHIVCNGVAVQARLQRVRTIIGTAILCSLVSIAAPVHIAVWLSELILPVKPTH